MFLKNKNIFHTVYFFPAIAFMKLYFFLEIDTWTLELLHQTPLLSQVHLYILW